MLTIPGSSAWGRSGAANGKRKPENQVRKTLEAAKLIPDQRTEPKLDALLEQWTKERHPP